VGMEMRLAMRLATSLTTEHAIINAAKTRGVQT
jgi:hypothetical protein